MPLDGIIFDVSRACVDDGPGLRTVIFLKGCPLACPWCHNPEGRSPVIQTGVGRRVEVPWLVEQSLQDLDFYRGTGGGVTFSGGEPMAQPEFLLACAHELRGHGVHVALETSGFWDQRYQEQVAGSFDLLLFDLKHTRAEAYRQATGQPVEQVLENLRALHRAGANLELRITLVPGFNDGADDLEHMASWLRKNSVEAPVTLQPFHRLAAAKQERLGVEYPYADVEPVTPEQIEKAARVLGPREPGTRNQEQGMK